MGYTHYWRQKRAFTQAEWATITAEAKRICAKAQRGDYYTGKEDFASATKLEVDEMGFRHGFKEDYAWRTFPHADQPTPMQGAAIKLETDFDANSIYVAGVPPEDYESFVLERAPEMPAHYTEDRIAKAKVEGIFNCCKTEYRPYDAVVVSILFIATRIAPNAVAVSSDGGDEAIKLMF